VRAEQEQPVRIAVRRLRPDEWQASRAIRLEALADTPIGFLEVLADARQRTDEGWRERARAVSEGDEQALFLAWDGERPIGTAGGWRRDGGPAVVVFAVYVTPSRRGADVLDRLLDAVEGWARGLEGVTELRLEVHEDNARARAAYARRGFAETGASCPYEPDPTRLELEMVRPLSP
jgi:GNAT superfamily N-acetyltransferase